MMVKTTIEIFSPFYSLHFFVIIIITVTSAHRLTLVVFLPYAALSMALYLELSSVLVHQMLCTEGLLPSTFAPMAKSFTNLFSQYWITEVEYHIVNSNYTGIEIS